VYIDLRCHERRLYTDEEVAWLPDIADDHVHKKEWEIRKTSCRQLIKYLNRRNKLLKILEVGCGNGWLSYQLSQIPDSNIIGLDVNLAELQQAERVFHGTPNLNFIYGELSSLSVSEKFDIIVFAASIQYFALFTGIIEAALDRLKDSGEIHITDSHFYYETDVEDARQRSHHYFQSKGFDRMDDFYFHHSLKDLDGFNYTILYDPNAVLNKILKRKNHFHWICIKK
jgi:ubiquinone/menaquinone biosynthesis C-methylase UbiE